MKTTVNVFAAIAIAPIAYPVKWAERLDRNHLVFQFGSQFVSLAPGILGVYLRRAFYKVVLGIDSQTLVIEFGTILAQRGIKIGNNVYIGPFCNVGLCEIEDDVLVGSNVDIVSGRHVHYFDDLSRSIRAQGGELKMIKIGKGSWIGNRAVVMESVGEECVIGAGTIVTRECEAWHVFAGNPAKQIRRRGE